MKQPRTTARTWVLPPLILHPFTDAKSPQKLVQCSRANLMLQGLLPTEGEPLEHLEQIVIDGRYCEIRMLYYIGKDAARWIEQCIEFASRDPDLRTRALDWRSFATLLIDETPAPVLEKLKSWGVGDHRAIFSRGLGLNCIFADAPPRDLLSSGFIRNYHCYADEMFACRMRSAPCARAAAAEFDFELFASGEYTRMLERQWAADAQG